MTVGVFLLDRQGSEKQLSMHGRVAQNLTSFRMMYVISMTYYDFVSFQMRVNGHFTK